MNDNYHNYKAIYDDARQQNKSAVFDVLTAAGITNLAVDFDGYGDSGQIEGITAQAGVADAELPKTAVTIHEVTHVRSGNYETPKDEAKQQPLVEAIEGLCYDYLEEHHGGWEIDDGSFGRFEFNVSDRAISLEFNGRISDVVTEFEEF
jgi:hypothetical protein